MDSRKLALGLAAVSLAWVGCGGDGGTVFEERDFVCAEGASPPCETTEPAHTDAERTATEGTGDETSYLFVVNYISIPEPMSGQAPGFNLDNLDSGRDGDPTGNCEAFTGDFTSEDDPDHVGVDNALATLVPTIESLALDGEDLDDTLLMQINEGSILLGVRVTGVNDLEFDSNVQMQLVLLETADGNPPMVGGDGRLAPDQAYNVAMELGIAVDGDLFDGRVAASTASLPLMINAGDIMLTLNISSPQVRFDISGDGLSHGIIGGFITIDDIVAAAAEAGGIDEATVRPVVQGYADITPSAADPMTCEALSVGLKFEATTATTP